MQRFFLLAACAALFLVGCGDSTKKDGAGDKDNAPKTGEKADADANK